MTDWFTTDDEDRLLAAWDGAPTENEEICGFLLDVARTQVMSFAADDDEPGVKVSTLLEDLGISPAVVASVLALIVFPANPKPPARYVFAQLQQARNLHAAGKVTPAGEIGPEGFSYQPRPLDKTIRMMIRPATGGASAF